MENSPLNVNRFPLECSLWFREVEERVNNFASGLEQEGLTPPNPDGMKLLALYSRNRPEWIVAEQVCAPGLWISMLGSVEGSVF